MDAKQNSEFQTNTIKHKKQQKLMMGKIKNYASLLEVNKSKPRKEGLKIKKSAKTHRGTSKDSEILRLTHDFSENTIIQKNLAAFNEFQKYQQSVFKHNFKTTKSPKSSRPRNKSNLSINSK